VVYASDLGGSLGSAGPASAKAGARGRRLRRRGLRRLHQQLGPAPPAALPGTWEEIELTSGNPQVLVGVVASGGLATALGASFTSQRLYAVPDL
jgi:hypothetical protein